MTRQSQTESIRKLVLTAVFSALIIVMTVTPYLGYISYGGIEITTLHIVTILAGVCLGPLHGAFVGAVWGLSCIVRAYVMFPIYLDFGFGNFFVACLPRILVGFVAGAVFMGLRKCKLPRFMLYRRTDSVSFDGQLILIDKKNIAVCMLLSVVSCGIYYFYWQYKILKNIRAITKKDSSCFKEMVCLIFIPYYSVFWWFTRGAIVNKELSDRGHSVLGKEITYLLLSIFGLQVVALAIMQNDFNQLKSEDTQYEKRTIWFASVSAVCGTLTNTVCVLTAMHIWQNVHKVGEMSGVRVIFGDIFKTLIAVNGVIELVAAVILVPALYRAVSQVMKRAA